MADLTFTIKTPAELAGAEAAAKAMEVNIGKAKALGKGVAELEAQFKRATAAIEAYTAANGKMGGDDSAAYSKKLEAMAGREHEAKVQAWKDSQATMQANRSAAAATGEAAVAVENHTAKTEHATEKGKLFEGHSKELKKTIKELSHEFPIAGAALRAFANPIGSALALGIAAFVAVKRHVDSLNESLDKMEEAAREPLSNFKIALQEIQRVAAEKEVGKAFENFGVAVSGIKSKCDQAITAIHNLQAAQKDLFASEEEKKLAEIKVLEAKGKAGYAGGITGEEAAQRRAAVKDEYAAKQKTLDKDAAQAVIAAQEKAIGETKAKQAESEGLIIGPGRANTIAARIKTIGSDARGFARDPVTGVAVGAEIKAREEAVAKAEKEVEKRREMLAYAMQPEPFETAKGRANRELGTAEAEKKLRESETTLETARRSVAMGDKFSESSANRISALKQEVDASERAEAKVKELTATLKEMADKLEELKAGISLQQGHGERTERNKSDARALEAEAEGITAREAEAKRAEEERKKRGRGAVEENRKAFKGGDDSASLTPDVDTVVEAVAADRTALREEFRAALNELAQRIADAGSRNKDSLLG